MTTPDDNPLISRLAAAETRVGELYTELNRRCTPQDIRGAFLMDVEDGGQDDALDDVISVLKNRKIRIYELKPKCPRCGHPWDEHDQEIKNVVGLILAHPELDTLYECVHYAGMGDWCGCEERSRRPVPK